MKKKTKYPKNGTNNEKEEYKKEQNKTKYPKEEKICNKNEKKKKIKKEKQNKKKNNSDDDEKDDHSNTYNNIEIFEEKPIIYEINDITEQEIKDNLDNIDFDEFFDEIEENLYNKNDIVENYIEEETLERDKIINKQFNPYTINGELNNYLNPFINNNKKLDNSDILDIDLEKDNEYFTSSSSNKSESEIKLNKEKNDNDNNEKCKKEIKDEEKILINRDYLSN